MSTLDQRVHRASRARRESVRSSARQAILKAAGELLATEGHEGLSLRRVAERVGYTATTIYRHFADKDALIYAVTEEAFQRLAERLRSAAAPRSDPFDALESIALAYIEFGLDEPSHYRLLFLSRPDLLWRRMPGNAGSRMERLGTMRVAVAAALATGRAGEKDVLAVSNALWAVTHGTAALALSIPHMPRRQAREVGVLAVRTFLRGLL